MATYLPFCLGGGGHISIHLFGKGMPLTCPCVREGMITYVPMYLKRDGHLFTYLGKSNHLSTHSLGGDGHLSETLFDCHLSIHLFGRWWKSICLFIREMVIIYLPTHLGGDGHNVPSHVGVDGQLPI